MQSKIFLGVQNKILRRIIQLFFIMTGQVAVSQSKHKICDACRHSPRRKDHLTPLLRATQNGHPACLQAIVHRIDINKEDLSYLLDETSRNGKTAVALAAKYGYHE